MQLGWRPLPEEGFTFDVGYVLGYLDDNAPIGAVLDALMASGEITSRPQASGTVGASSLIHMLDVEVGWRFLLEHGWAVRVGLGAAFTVASSTTARSSFTLVGDDQDPDAIARSAETTLNDVYRTYFHPPRVTLGLSYRFL